jgi:signal peptidase I
MFKKFLHSFWGETLQVIILSFIIVIPFRMYIAQPFLVSGPSMDDTFKDGQYLIVDELTYHLRDPHRGEVVIFKYPLDTKKYFIKRVIGLPGDTVEIKHNKVSICKNECQTEEDRITLEEPYIKSQRDKLSPPASPDITYTLKEDEYYVLGDNRDVSSDSRFWGPVKRELMTGRPFVRLLPLTKIGLFPGQINNNQ